MPSVNEPQVDEIASVNRAGLDTISRNQTITFTKYTRVVLPLDGYVFWVRSDMLKAGAAFNGFALNTAAFSASTSLTKDAATREIKGSLHYSVNQTQDEAEGFGINKVIFSSEGDVDELNDINPRTIYIGEFEGLRFSFSQRGMFYRQSREWHYVGDAIYPAMETQIIDFPAQLNASNVIVSNSLPIWLTLDQFCPMFPSYLVPDNIRPPWGAVHVFPEDTEALTLGPYVDQNGSSWQLTKDRVRVTLYGLRNFTAIDFRDYVLGYSANGGAMGLMNSPVPRDEKRTQPELSIIAQKKTIEFEVNYYQARIRNVTLQTIKRAFFEDIFVSTP